MALNQEMCDIYRLNNLHKNEFNLKFVVIGDFGVGKTSIINRYVDGEFSQKYCITIGADFSLKTIEWDDDTRIFLQLWDIAGHEKFSSLTGVFYRHSVGAAIVFDLTRPETFNSVPQWLNDLRRKTQLPDGKNIPVVILANKGDMTVDTMPQEITDFCENNNILAWYITSAKSNIQIDEAMIRLIMESLNPIEIEYTKVDNNIIKLNETKKTSKPFWKCFNT
ncbi:unnamed protein product [Brassicogethes aeneus]|uniref:Ras-related protein Rab n=1 Tax=Brassicogethes aeneus TaxID=1431903 RepID=A0A9P0BDR3_BRAAE|nr:unnamed protein product [Brassicogethes aeneus]